MDIYAIYTYKYIIGCLKKQDVFEKTTEIPAEFLWVFTNRKRMNGVITPMVNVKPVQLGKNVRMSFSRIGEVLEMPNLIEVQKNSYQWFLNEGLKEVFHDVSPITDYQGNLVLDFIDYRLDDTPKYTIAECKERDTTYAAPLRVRASLLNRETGEVKEQDIYMGDFPLMTDSGTFVINGAERVIVSQLVRSPGVYYSAAGTRPARSCSPRR